MTTATSERATNIAKKFGTRPEEPDIWRQQATSGRPEVSPQRTGTFFATGKEFTVGDPFGHHTPLYGGPHLVGQRTSGRVLDLGESTGDLGAAARKHLQMPRPQVLHEVETQGYGIRFDYLKSIGVPEEEAASITEAAIAYAERSEPGRSSNTFSAAIQDAAVAARARSLGYDAIRQRGKTSIFP